MSKNGQFVLKERPQGEAVASNFEYRETDVPQPGPGQVVVKHHFLSLDPYMRGRMNDGKSYADPQPLGEVMIGGTVGEVVASQSPLLSVGDKVVGMGGWQHYACSDAKLWRRIEDDRVPLSHYLGAVGMPGVTAWLGLVRIIEPKAGETITVSAASGAVGSAVGFLAKQRGCRVVGIAGGADKCRYVVEELGFDACVDYKQHTDLMGLAKALKAECPNGIDGHFENVGGKVLDAVMMRTNAFARLAVCGMIAGYNGEPIPMQYPQLILTNRLKVQGFIVSEQMEVWPQALKELAQAVGSGQFRPRETIAEGLKSAPEAFLGLLKGANFGKQVVRLVEGA
jgi:NADPH-dependent curcumin reductase CurA